MVKSGLITRIHKKLKHLSFKDVELSVNHTLEHMSAMLEKGKRIEIRGFGSFMLRRRLSRQAHNPKTGEWGYTQEKYAPHFKPGKGLRERVDNNRKNCEIKTAGASENEQSAEEE